MYFTSCKDCAVRSHWIGKKHTSLTREKINKANKGQEYNKSRLGIKESIETRTRKSQALKGRKGGFIGKNHNLKTKEKQRIGRLRDIDSKYPLGWTTPNYNVKACRLFDEINSTLGWNGVHTENVGEFRIAGYSLDYYEPVENVVIEFDEASHNNKKQQVKDKIRQDRITEVLKCRFFRIKAGSEMLWQETLGINREMDRPCLLGPLLHRLVATDA